MAVWRKGDRAALSRQRLRVQAPLQSLCECSVTGSIRVFQIFGVGSNPIIHFKILTTGGNFYV